MIDFYFERECRTPQSECYTVMQDDNALGRVDVHYAQNIIHATLSIAESLTNDDIQFLVDRIDEELLDSVGISREEVIVHVHQGRDLGVFSTRNFEGNGGRERMN